MEHKKKTQNNSLGYSLLPLSIDPKSLCSLPSHSKIVIEITNFPKVCQGLVRYCCEEDGPINCVVQPNTFPVRDADVGYITLRIAGDLERPWGQQWVESRSVRPWNPADPLLARMKLKYQRRRPVSNWEMSQHLLSQQMIRIKQFWNSSSFCYLNVQRSFTF